MNKEGFMVWVVIAVGIIGFAIVFPKIIEGFCLMALWGI